jgi:SAM-dependent methyltransferase
LAVERVAFEDPAVSYHSYHGAQHVVRYATVKDIAAGKRVLDVACGEGYGARLLLEWGAREVVGLDISPAAIDAAKRQFGGKDVTFLVGDAESLDTALADVEPFDLVVSFETVEHLARPDDFLAALPTVLAPGGTIVISCPNDHAYSRSGHDNPFHIRPYTFDDFRSLTQQHLGTATMWLLGAPLLGELNFRPGDEFVEHRHDLQAAILDVRPIENTLALPAQSNLTTNAAQCSHYIGLWGAQVRPNAVISSLSVSEYQAPWQRVGHLETRVAELERRQTDHYEPEIARLTDKNAQLEAANAALGDENARLEVENAELRGERKALSANADELRDWLAKERASVEQSLFKQGTMAARIGEVLEPNIESLTSQLSMLQQENARLTRRQSEAAQTELERKAHLALKAELEVATAALDKLEKEKAEYYEPELARLKSHVEHSKFEKETQMLRRRVMAYADQSRRIGGAVVTLETKLAELEHLRDSWYVPELERLAGIIEQQEKIKREWFEPQLDSRAAHIATLEEQVHSRDALIKSLESKNAVRVGKSETAAAKSSGRIFRFKR